MANLGSVVIDLQMNVAKMTEGTAKATKELEKISKSTQTTAKHMGELDKVMGRIQRTMSAFVFVYAFRQVTGVISDAVSAMINFNSQLETAKLGIASILLSQGEFTNSVGESVQGYQALTAAQRLSGDIIRQLQVDNLKTMATFSQLTKAFQQTLAPALEKGFNLQQVREYTVAMVQAAGALGLNLDMLAEETRSMLRGTITPRTTLIATALGITNEQIREYEDNTQGLFDFVMGKLKAFSEAGVESQKTWAGLVSNLKDAFERLMGEGLKPLYDYVKQQLQEVYDNIITLNKATGDLEINPKFIKQLKDISEKIIAIVEEVKWLYGVFSELFFFEPPQKGLEKTGEKIDEIGEKVDTLSDKLKKMEWPSESRFIPEYTFTPTIKKDPKLLKGIVEEGTKAAKIFTEQWAKASIPMVNAMHEMGQKSQVLLQVQTKAALENLEAVRNQFYKTGKGAYDYANALKAVIEQMKQLIGPDIHDELMKNTIDIEEAMRAVPADDPERQKKIQNLIDTWLKTRKEIQAKKITPEVDIPAWEQQLNTLKQKAISMFGDFFKDIKKKTQEDFVRIEFDKFYIQGEFEDVYKAFKDLKGRIESEKISITIEGGKEGREVSGIKAYGQPIEKFGISPDFFTGGQSLKNVFGEADQAAQNVINDWRQLKEEMGSPVDIAIYATGSTRRPITDKIQEIIQDFGGLENALKGLEANIQFIGLSANLLQLENQLKNLNKVAGGITDIVQWTGKGWVMSGRGTLAEQQYALSSVLPIKAELERVKAEMAYQRLYSYGSSMQSGGIVPRTGLYRLHEGERVTSKSVSMGNININLPTGTSKEQAKEIAKQLALIIKYKRSGDLAEYV